MAELRGTFTFDVLVIEYRQYPDEPGETWKPLMKLQLLEAIQFVSLLNRLIENKMLLRLPVKCLDLKTGREI